MTRDELFVLRVRLLENRFESSRTQETELERTKRERERERHRERHRQRERAAATRVDFVFAVRDDTSPPEFDDRIAIYIKITTIPFKNNYTLLTLKIYFVDVIGCTLALRFNRTKRFTALNVELLFF